MVTSEATVTDSIHFCCQCQESVLRTFSFLKFSWQLEF